MRIATGIVYGTVAVIVGLTVVSGPLVGAVDFTRDRTDLAGLGTGNVSVDRVSAPESVELGRAYQSESYHLEVPDATINVTAISGRPVVAYRVEIPALGYARSTSHFLDESRTGSVRLSIERDRIVPDRVDDRRYDGTLSVVARYNDTERVLYRDPVPVEVTG